MTLHQYKLIPALPVAMFDVKLGNRHAKVLAVEQLMSTAVDQPLYHHGQ
jgi:hypothetical protein